MSGLGRGWRDWRLFSRRRTRNAEHGTRNTEGAGVPCSVFLVPCSSFRLLSTFSRRIPLDHHRGGWIEIIAGGMFSGKSEELIRRLRRAVIARQRVQVFKPILDDRFATDEVVSRDDRRLKAHAVATSAEMLARVEIGA